MKSKITKKLIIYFLIILAIYSIFSSILFLYFGDRSFKKSYENHLIEKAESIAESFVENEDLFKYENNVDLEENSHRRKGKDGKEHKMKISPSYIKWMNKVLESDVWIVDKDKNLVRFIQNGETIEFEKLNNIQRGIIDSALNGIVKTSEEFSLAKNDTLTAAVPIKDKEGNIDGAVLLHEKFSEKSNFVSSIGIILLISTIISLILVAIMAVFIAKKFVDPLKKLDNMANKLIAGDYNSKSSVEQDDEIGDLAKNMDNLSERLLIAKKESESLQQMRDDFVSSISHELKTPVTVMKSSLELLNEGVVKGEEVEEYYKVLYKESIVLERLIQDLMELTMLQNVNFKIDKKEVNVIDVIKDSVRSQRIFALDKDIEIRLNLIEKPIFFNGDYTRLRQMFITVINNAIKFSKDKSYIEVNEKENVANVEFEIKNLGDVIPKEVLKLIFNSFYRDKNSKEKGFGLGLAISKEIAKVHNINIEVTSDIKEGTRFIFKIPKNLILD